MGTESERHVLDEAELELVGIYSDKLSAAYAKGQLAACDQVADRLLHYLPEDPFARFVKGAVAGRHSTTADLRFDEAFDWWIPLMSELSSDGDAEDREALIGAISTAFAIMTDTPLDLGIRAWNALRDVKSITDLADTLEAYLSLADSFTERTAAASGEDLVWIPPLFADNWSHWTARVIQPNTAIPSRGSECAESFGRMTEAAVEMARRIPEPRDESAQKVYDRTLFVRENYLKMC